jgi:hypothetical protein
MKCQCGNELKIENIELGRWVEPKPTLSVLHCDWCGLEYCRGCGSLLKDSGEYWKYCPKCYPKVQTREDIYTLYGVKEREAI